MKFILSIVGLLIPLVITLSPQCVRADSAPLVLPQKQVSLVSGKGSAVSVTGLTFRGKEVPYTSFGNWDATLAFQGGISNWSGHEDGSRNARVTDLSITPILSLYPRGFELSKFVPYVEMGLGAHLISKTYINRDRRFATAYQFGEHVEVGVRFGTQKEFGLGVFVQHVSNGSIKEPNNGLTYSGVKFSYGF